MKEKLKELCEAYCSTENSSELLYDEIMNLFNNNCLYCNRGITDKQNETKENE